MSRKVEMSESLFGAGPVSRYGDEVGVVDYVITVTRMLVETTPGEYLPGLQTVTGKLTGDDATMGELFSTGGILTLALEDGREWSFVLRDAQGAAHNAGRGLWNPSRPEVAVVQL